MTKLKFFFSRNEKKLLFLLVGLLLLFFLYVSTDESFDWERNQMNPVEQILPAQTGQVFEQRLVLSSEDALRAVKLQFFAYGRENRAAAFVELLEDGELRDSWEINTAVLTDYTIYEFKLHETFIPKRGADYRVRIHEEFSGENGIGICADGDGDLIIGLTYRDQSRRNFALLAGAVIYLIICLWVLLGGSESRLRALLLTVCVLSCVWLIPPTGRDDEDSHLQRAYQISTGRWVSPYITLSDPRETDGFAGRDMLPAAISQFSPLNREVVLNEEDTSEAAIFFANYSPVGYFPHALGVYAARCFTSRVEYIYYAGCISGAVFNLLLCFLALSCMPFGKNILFVIMMLPVSIEQMSGVTQDGLLFAVSFLFLAYVLRLAYKKARVCGWDIFVLAGLTAFIGLCKSTYVGLLLLLFLIPGEKFERGRGTVWKIGLLLLGVILDLLWTVHAGRYLYEMNPGVDRGGQIWFILTHPVEFYKIVVLHCVAYFDLFLMEYLVEYDYKGISSGPSALLIFFLVLLISEMYRCEHTPTKVGRFDKLLCLAAVLGSLAMTIVSVYAAFLPVGEKYIVIGGRYLIPMLGCFCVFFLLPFKHGPDKAGVALPVPEERLQQKGGSLIPMQADQRATYLYLLLLSGNGISMSQILQKWTETIWH